MPTVATKLRTVLRIVMVSSRRSSELAGRPFKAAMRASSCCKMFMVPLKVFSLLEMGMVMVELRTSTGDAAIDKARKRVVDKDVARIMIDHWQYSNVRTIPDFVAHYIYGDERKRSISPSFSHV